MNKLVQLITLTAILLLATPLLNVLYAQKSSLSLGETKADTYFDLQEFAKAEAQYLALLDNAKLNVLASDRVSLKLAAVLYHTRRYAEAEKRFGAVITRNLAAYTPEYACAYIATLVRSSKFKQAYDVGERFSRIPAYKNHQPLQNLMEGVRRQAAADEMASIGKASFNQHGSNYASVPFRGGVIFVNNKPDEKSMIKGAQFFYDDGRECKQYTKIPYTMQAGPACFTNDGKTILYTDNRYKEKQLVRSQKDKAIAINYLNIVELSYDEKSRQWENPKSIFTNKPFSSMCHPSVSEDGQRLYFSADFGGQDKGMDIYMSRKTTKGWGEPVSLGLAVNTKDSELYPCVRGSRLCFSSNGHTGSGGMDIYSVELGNDGLPIQGSLNHFLYPINTVYNDYALMYNLGGEGGYFTSDRPDSRMLDAIYSWSNDVSIVPENPLIEKAEVVIKSKALAEFYKPH